MPVVAPEALPTLVQDKLRTLLADRASCPGERALARSTSITRTPASSASSRSPGEQCLPSRQDYLVAAVVLAEGLAVTFCPYLIEDCADETWQLERFPTPREQSALGERLDSTDLEEALDIRAGSEEAGDFGLTWVEPPPFQWAAHHVSWGGSEQDPDQDPDLPALAHLHACEYSATGYFGNEGGDVDFYTYGALHVEIRRMAKGPRRRQGRGASGARVSPSQAIGAQGPRVSHGQREGWR